MSFEVLDRAETQFVMAIVQVRKGIVGSGTYPPATVSMLVCSACQWLFCTLYFLRSGKGKPFIARNALISTVLLTIWQLGKSFGKAGKGLLKGSKCLSRMKLQGDILDDIADRRRQIGQTVLVVSKCVKYLTSSVGVAEL